jgi:hypothetical protein
MTRAAQRLNALDDDLAATCPLDPGSHGREEIREVRHLRFTRCVFEDGLSIRKHGGHEQVLRTRHGNRIKDDMGAPQTVGAGLDEAVFDGYVGPHRP